MKTYAGINRLARTLDRRSNQNFQKPNELELGVIQSDFSLKVDRFKVPIPKSDYLVSESLTLPSDFMTSTEANSGAHAQYEYDGKHDHQIVTPEQLKPLSAGDRVLVGWVNDGTDPIVLCRVVSI